MTCSTLFRALSNSHSRFQPLNGLCPLHQVRQSPVFMTLHAVEIGSTDPCAIVAAAGTTSLVITACMTFANHCNSMPTGLQRGSGELRMTTGDGNLFWVGCRGDHVIVCTPAHATPPGMLPGSHRVAWPRFVVD